MHLLKFETTEELNNAGADFMVSLLHDNGQALVCAATGDSPTGMYKKLVEKQGLQNTVGLKFVKLDEWAGLPMDHPGSCEHYLQQHLLKPLNIPAENYVSFDSQANIPAVECKRIQHYLAQNGPIDLCVLGLGLNGHIAFNDPANKLQPGIHLAELSATSLAHPMVLGVATDLKYGYTLGIADILQSKTILLIVNGRHKKNIFQEFLKGQISTQLPASFLWLHANAYCYYCEN